MDNRLKILIVGNDPHQVAGVPNYTRPLAIELSRLGNRVFYFYSGVTGNSYNWFFRPYLRFNRKDFPFECAEVINSPNWIYNFADPLIDVHNRKTEWLFENYINRIQPDVMHVHSRLGLPASIIAIAADRGISVLNTIHIFGMLCPKRVMIDKEGIPCDGPDDLQKCADCCVEPGFRRAKLRARLANIHPNLPMQLLRIKNTLYRKKIEEKRVTEETQSTRVDAKKYTVLQSRLESMIDLMNQKITQNICVSTDVKNTLLRFGVKENKLMVQHIGSVIAEKQKPDFHDMHNPIVIGNIGGVAHYKGTHVLLEAVSRMKNKNFRVKIFGKFDSAYREKIMQDKEKLPVEFFGKYTPDELPIILEQIDIMVLPSICKDTAPQTIFESYSARIPIIASDIGGFPDFIQNGENGFLFESGNSRHLADRLDNILANPDKVKSFAQKIPHLKTIKVNAIELIDLYRRSR